MTATNQPEVGDLFFDRDYQEHFLIIDEPPEPGNEWVNSRWRIYRVESGCFDYEATYVITTRTTKV